MNAEPAVNDIINQLRGLAEPGYIEKLNHFGSRPENALGIRRPVIRDFAKTLGKNHELALELWETGIHEARGVAAAIADPNKFTQEDGERWIQGFESWDVCDDCCAFLFRKCDWAWDVPIEWSTREREYEKRAGFVMMVVLGIHHKKASDDLFRPFFERIDAEAGDPRNFVRKAVNWALRQLGKRSLTLHPLALELAQKLSTDERKSARWVGSNAKKELSAEKTIERLKQKARK